MKRTLAVLFGLLLVLGAAAIGVSALPGNPNSASIPHPVECPPFVNCPPTPVPPPGGSTFNPGDPDGDGIPNGFDQCPNEGGPSSNQGCPPGANPLVAPSGASVGLVTPTLPIVILPTLPTSKKVCALATRTNEPVNLHSQPSLQAQIIGVLDPQQLYYPDSSLQTLDGSIWYALVQPFGWVAGSVVRVSAGCPYVLPAYKVRPITDQNPLPLSYVNGPHIVLDKGDGSGKDTPQGYCAPSFGIDLTASDGSKIAIHFAFGDGSVQPTPEQGCIQLNSDGHGFVIEPPPDPDKPGFPTPWTVGTLNNELTLVALLQPNPGSQPPGPPVEPGVTLAWSLTPPGPPIKPGDPSDQTKGGVLNFVIGWSLIPPGPCKTGDQSCPPGPPVEPSIAIDWTTSADGNAQMTGKVPPNGPGPGGAGSQGIVVNGALIPPGPPDKQPLTIDFFPNGFDPSVGGFTQIENQPGGSAPGDQYGFTQIENQPLGGGVAIQIELPAVQ